MKASALSVLIAASLAAPSVVADDSESARIKSLEQRVSELESDAQLNSWLERFHVNGFASMAIGRADNNAGYAGYDDEDFDYEQGSLFAVQTTYDINENMEATMQLITRGRQDWEPKIEWAFVSYQFDNGTKVRGGKLRLPFYMLSDYLEVGYAYPWARPSEEVYGVVPVTSYTGIDVLHSVDFEESTLTFQPILGEATVDSDDSRLGVETDFEKVMGMATTYDWDELTLRASYFRSDTKFDDASRPDLVDLLDDKTGEFFGVGARWDQGDWMVMAEFTRIEVDDAYPDTDSVYIGATYRFDQFSPYLMYSWVESKDNDEREIPIPGLVSALDVERAAYSAGVRWDFMTGMALKLDLTYTDDFDETTGGLPGNIGVSPDFPQVGAINTGEYDDSFVYSVVLDVVF
ncbi:porin [Corallincola platygyrae]|uniref:Porin n=1 Tax=Corallincola platygyrae TaxID=1193278 RepID=A0ABW4XT40_9GAMM